MMDQYEAWKRLWAPVLMWLIIQPGIIAIALVLHVFAGLLESEFHAKRKILGKFKSFSREN
jgi:hypothetical protein